jgi:hypothetical protein
VVPRSLILARRAQIMVAAGISSAIAGCEPCLSLRPCNSDLIEIDGPTRLCVNQTATVRLRTEDGCEAGVDITDRATFASSDPSIAVIENNNIVRALKVGRVTISATANDKLDGVVVDVEACTDAAGD